jgi:Asp-tRNA(Asn)/Glu-tRNA(Gln) amidotransferase B subunit
MSEELMDAAGKIQRVVVDAALAGDIQAAQLVLNRVTPNLRAQSQTVEFDFDAAASLATQVEQVLAAVATGDIAPDTAKQIVESIGALAAVRQVDELARRLDALEGRSPQ